MADENANFCDACGKRLKKLVHETEIKMAFHKKCFNKIIQDLKHFDEKLAIEKYGYSPLYCGKTKKEIEEGEELIIEFD
tara:strand:- start:519 stop:755 length:237 start_codon:yes stop_codon:yes gene_type:complete